METTEGWVSPWSASLYDFKKTGSLVIDANYDMALVGDVYSEVFFHFLQFDALTATLWQLFCPFFQGIFPNTVVVIVTGVLTGPSCCILLTGIV